MTDRRGSFDENYLTMPQQSTFMDVRETFYDSHTVQVSSHISKTFFISCGPAKAVL